DQVQELLVADTAPQQLHQLAVVDRVEVRRDVPLDGPEVSLALLGVAQQVADRVHRTAVGAEPEGEGAKVRLEGRYEAHGDSFLYQPITKSRDAERAHLAVRFGDVHPPYGTGCNPP